MAQLAIQIVLGVLVLFAVMHIVVLGRDLVKHRNNLGSGNWIISIIIGFVTDFLDTLGIGSFAPTAMLLDTTKQLETDRHLPGTLNVGHALSCLLEGLIFITVVNVDPLTLFSLIAASIVGSWLGSKTVTKLPEKTVQFWMGWALIVTAILMALRSLGLINLLGEGNTATGLSGGLLIVGIIGNGIFGALMTIGVGLYAPCMAMVYMLGLSPLVAFPIMSGSCGALMPVASLNFIKTGEYSRKVSLGIALGGIVGVIIAAKFVTNLDLTILTWVIIVVVIITGITYIRKSRKPAVAQ
ncbi:TSUP family transporter [Enterococcus sp. AZ109]|uniref:TSUP family transporter n=1 Tax=Enterococcus sp. AZ109 TaxID=2774634 RepID=UPI003F688967